ncbi:SCO family protein [Devosia sp.]|uniref:SCO family protein n=1 Tax=Devosia sp. TaxID=1871048 RepID=UPI0025C12B0D|nr:SCO family protein [Devosia sp.]
MKVKNLKSIAFAATILAALASPALSHSLDYVEQQLMENEDYFQPVDSHAPDFALEDAAGNPVEMADLRGKVVILNFIYTNCGDFCPLHTELLAALQAMINPTPMRDRVKFVTITTDPSRDTGAVLAEYSKAHGADLGNWLFLTTQQGQPEDTTRTVAKGYGLEFTQTEDGEQMHGVVTHVIDQDGRLKARFHGLKVQPLSIVTFVNALVNRDLPDDGHGDPGLLDWLKGLLG